jgi:DSBA-like thioredoxin domain
MRWVSRLEALGAVRVEWAVFSLAIANRGDDEADPDQGAGRALRTAIAVRRTHGNAALGRFFAALGRAIHEDGQSAADMETVEGALADSGMDKGLATDALEDPTTWRAVVAEHSAAVAEHEAFGVPTIVLDGGGGPAIFGPVISDLPPDDEAVELWRHVRWLVRNQSFSELKRARPRRPTFATGIPTGRAAGDHAHAA